MKNFIKKMLGIDKLEEQAQLAIELSAKIADTEQKLKDATRNPKEIATENKEPWVAVLQTHVGKENVRNGFFELDWNEYFVLLLRTTGYTGDTDEDVVDQWFTELCRNVGGEEGIDLSRRSSGYVNKSLRDDGKTEIS